MRATLCIVAMSLCGQAASATDSGLSTVLLACSNAKPAPEAVLGDLRAGGWTDPTPTDLQNLAQGLQLGSLLYDHLDTTPEDAAAAQKGFAAGSADILQNILAKTAPPFDTMNAHILAAPDGTVAEMNWSDIGGKLYYSCRIAPASLTKDAIVAEVEQIFTDPYLERSDTDGSNGSKSVWNDFDNEQIYIYGLNSGVIGPNPLITVQTLVSPEG